MASKNKLIQTLKSNKLFSLRTVEEGTVNDVKRYYDSGSYVINLILSGDMFKGYMSNKITALSGDSGTGKTFLALAAAKSLLESDKNAAVIFLDTEGATDKDQILGLGIDGTRIEHELVNNIETLSEMLLTIATEQKALPEKDRSPLMVIIDSLGNLSTNKEMTDLSSGNDKVDMTKAKKVTAMFRAATVPLTEAGICTIFTNHVYDTQEMFSQKVMKGGKGLVYLASTILEFSKRKDKEGTEVVGNIIHAKARKARKAKENAIVDSYISYKTGLNRYFGLIELAEGSGLVKRVGNRYEFPDGQKLFLKEIIKNPETCYTKEFLVALNDAVRSKFNYGSGADDLVDDTEDEESVED